VTKVVFEIEAADLEDAQKKARRWLAYGDHHGLEISHRHLTAEPPVSFTKPNGDRGKKFKFVAWVNAEQNDKRLLRMLENVDAGLSVISPKLPVIAALSMTLGIDRMKELGLADSDTEQPVREMSLARKREMGLDDDPDESSKTAQRMTSERRAELGIE
jgi:hypothetical protein